MNRPPIQAANRRHERRSGALRGAMDRLYGIIRWAGAHARGLYGAVGLFLLIGLAAAALCLAMFALVARGVMGGATESFDQAAIEWIRARRAPWLDWLALAGAVLGSGTAALIVLGVGSALLWFSRHRLSALLLWIALLGGSPLVAILKAVFGRPRPQPEEWNVTILGRPIEFPSTPSFPSGHAITSVIIFGTLAYLVIRLESTVRMRRWTLALAAGMILLIGLSRIYLGVHYPSDVLAGWLVGIVWATFAALSIEVIRYFAYREPAVAREEEDLDEGLRPIRETVEGTAP